MQRLSSLVVRLPRTLGRCIRFASAYIGLANAREKLSLNIAMAFLHWRYTFDQKQGKFGLKIQGIEGNVLLLQSADFFFVKGLYAVTLPNFRIQKYFVQHDEKLIRSNCKQNEIYFIWIKHSLATIFCLQEDITSNAALKSFMLFLIMHSGSSI